MMKWLGLVVLAACSSPKGAQSDASNQKYDAQFLDAAADAPPDALPDAPPDAPPGFSPACTTTPTILLATTTRQVGWMALAGNTLYVSAEQIDNSVVSDVVIYTIDLATDIAAAPSAMVSDVVLSSAGDYVYASEYRPDGTIWQLHPGDAPVALVQHLATPTYVTADPDYVYWADTSNMVSRRLLAGGTIETVMTCTDASRLILDGANIYCASDGHVFRTPAPGGSTPEEMTTMITDYPISSMIKSGTSLYYVNLDVFPDLLAIDTAGSTAALVQKDPMHGRYTGLAASSSYFYISDDFGLRRVQRNSLAIEMLVPKYGVFHDPVLWNHDLFYEDDDPQLSGERYVMHCVD